MQKRPTACPEKEPSEFYSDVYRNNPKYAMKTWRQDVVSRLYACYIPPAAGSVLDVGCGRAESRTIALRGSNRKWRGCEIVPSLCGPDVDLIEAATNLFPYRAKSFDVVSAFDVLEHLTPDCVPLAIKEFARVARQGLLLGIPHTQDQMGCHLTVEPKEWWSNKLLEAKLKVRMVTYPEVEIPEIKRPYTFYWARCR